MKLPETPNANYQYAFKKGYRLAAEGKTMATMPSSVRVDVKMREYFQQGWQQFHEDMAEAAEEKESPWRKRFAWWSMMALAGVATAFLMVHNIQTEKQQQYAEQTSLKDNSSEKIYVKQPPSTIEEPALEVTENKNTNFQPVEPVETLSLITPETLTKTIEAPSVVAEEKLTKPAKVETVELSLLSETQRSDLALTKQEYEAEREDNRQKSPSTITNNAPQKVKLASLTTAIKNRAITEELTGIIPKHIRKLYFFTQIEQASGEKIYHRWLFGDQVLATVPLTIKASPYRTWSSKRLSSAWQGSWRIEVLNEKMEVIHVEKFNYVK